MTPTNQQPPITEHQLRRTLHPETRVLNKTGLVEYVASDETVDSYREIIKANGWRFTHFAKNAPFVDSHDYYGIDKLLGRVTEFRVDGDKLVERVQWAIDVPENQLAQLGWKMTEAGYLRAVSVGFRPTRYVVRGQENWTETVNSLGLPPDTDVRAIYLEQEQYELSSVILGANPNALVRSGVLSQQDLDTWDILRYGQELDTSDKIRYDTFLVGDITACSAIEAAQVERALERRAFLNAIQGLTARLKNKHVS